MELIWWSVLPWILTPYTYFIPPCITSSPKVASQNKLSARTLSLTSMFQKAERKTIESLCLHLIDKYVIMQSRLALEKETISSFVLYLFCFVLVS